MSTAETVDAVVEQQQPVDTDATVKRLNAIRGELRKRLIKREAEIDLLIWSVLARTHLLFIGERGVAKSAAVDLFHEHITGANRFSILYMKFTRDEEVLGQVSLKAYENDEFRRITTGKLPEAHIAFADEIFKANSAILNAKLGIMNERKFKANGHVVTVPLWSLVGASNELPTEPELAPFRDRFGATAIVKPVTGKRATKQILELQMTHNRKGAVVSNPTTVTKDEIEALQELVPHVSASDAILDALVRMRQLSLDEGLNPSLRRIGEGVKLCSARAVLDGRSEIRMEDLSEVFPHVLFDDIEDEKIAAKVCVEFKDKASKEAKRLRDVLEQEVLAPIETVRQAKSQQGSMTGAMFNSIAEVNSKREKISKEIQEARKVAERNGEDTAPFAEMETTLTTSVPEAINTLMGF